MDNYNNCNDKRQGYNSTANSINSNDMKMDTKDFKRKLDTEKKLAHCKEEMSQLVDRIASKSFQG